MGDRNLAEISMAQQTPQSTHSTRACDECNRKKTRCDRKFPKCGLCERTQRHCEFPRKRKTYTRSSEPRKKLQKHTPKFDLEWLLTTLQNHPLGEAPSSFQHMASSPRGLDMNMDVPHSQAGDTTPVLDHEPETIGVNLFALDQDEFHLPSQSPTSYEQVGIWNGRAEASQSTVRFEVTGSTSNHLICLFFDSIQSWLPIFHRPKFVQQFTREPGLDDVLRGLPPDEALLLCATFSLSARFSPLETLSALPGCVRGQNFSWMANHFYSLCRHMTSPTLVYLQGCILHAFYFYCSGITSQGWILSGVCVRLAYELGLFDMDDKDSDVPLEKTWAEKEEMRRAWWLVWELDTFGSAVCCRPFMIDPSRMSVFLPVADELWFSDANTPSAKLLVRPGSCWKSLFQVENQCPRAFFLVANFLFSQVQSLCQRKDGISEGKLVCLENDISCLRLALPPSMSLESLSLLFESNPADRNWVIGTHFMLLSSSRMIQATIHKSHAQHGYTKHDQVRATIVLAYEKSRVLSRWDRADVATAHPFFAFMLIPFLPESGDINASEARALESCRDLARLFQREIALKWNLGEVASRIAELSEHPERITSEDRQLIKRHPAFFPSSVRNSASPCAQSPGARTQQTMPCGEQDVRNNPSPVQTISHEEEQGKHDNNSEQGGSLIQFTPQVFNTNVDLGTAAELFCSNDGLPESDFT